MMYHKAQNIAQACQILSEQECLILAGGTDIYPMFGEEIHEKNILDISSIIELTKISQDDLYYYIGAGVSWGQIGEYGFGDDLKALVQSAREVGAVQIQSKATIAGNLCTASPAGDGIVALMALSADIIVQSSKKIRIIPIREFNIGYRQTSLAKNEIITQIRIPKYHDISYSHFEKLGSRRYLVISIAMVAVRLAWDSQGYISRARVIVGACSPVAQNISQLETKLRYSNIAQDLTKLVAYQDFNHLSPINDVRASAQYRRDAVGELVKTSLNAIQNYYYQGKGK